MAVSGALDKVADGLTANPGGPPSPERKTKAIHMLKDIQEFENKDKVKIMQLIRADVAVADALLAVSNEPELRDMFLHAEIDTASA